MTMATNSNPVIQPQPAQSAANQTGQHSERAKNNCDDLNRSINTMVLFEALQNLELDKLDDKDLSGVLPFLTKLLLNPSFVNRQKLFHLLYPIEKMNDVIQLMTVKNIEPFDPSTVPPISSFECCSYVERLRMVASEYNRVQERCRKFVNPNTPNTLVASELFDNPIYIDEVSYCLCILLMKPSTNSLLNILDMAEAMLQVKYGVTYVIRLVANMPDRCQELCHSLINYGEKFDEGSNTNEISDHRAKTLRLICMMNPSIAFIVRSTTLQMCKMPSLTMMITLDHLEETLEKYDAVFNSSDRMDADDNWKELAAATEEIENGYDSAIAFITGLLLGADDGTRSWFALYIKSAQQRRADLPQSTLLSFRSQIMTCINHLFPSLLEDDCFVNQASEDSTNSCDSSIKSKLSSKDLNRKLIQATATLRLFCALRGIGSFKLNSDESEILMRLMTCRPAVNQISVNFATTGVCTLLACSALINNQKEEKRAAEWLKWLIKDSNYSDKRYSSHGTCSISELLLLIAIHFQNNQNSQIAELVCATLGMKLQIKASVSKCKSLFVQEVFNDQMVAEHAVKVPVTKSLNNNITEFLPVHCIHQLLESRSFSKHQVPIKSWIYEQICESKKPIHQILPKLIEAYVNSVIISTSIHGHCGTNQPISEEDIARVFRTHLYSVQKHDGSELNLSNGRNDSDADVDKKIRKEQDVNLMEVDTLSERNDQKEEFEPEIVDVEAAQVLLLYYLVLYEDVRLKKNQELTAAERSKLLKYSPDFMMEIPVFYLLQLVRDNQNSFGVILPDLLKLVTSQYPQLCSIQHWLTMDHYNKYCLETDDFLTKYSLKLSSASSFSSGSLQKPFKAIKENYMNQLVEGFENLEKDASPLIRTINHILLLSKEEIWPFVNLFIENLSRIIRLEVSDNPDYKKLIQVATKLWWKFNTVFPRKLWVMTVNSLKRPQNYRMTLEVKPVEYSWDELALDPLIVLRCDTRVFRCVDTLNIVLHILSAFLAASRRCLQDQINEQPGRQKDVRNLEELRATLILAQTSAAIQILLESCIPYESEQEALNKRESNIELDNGEKLLLDRFDSSVNCICEHLHQVFIADTNLAKLVHFQTYPSELLSTTSDKIPSMHICLDFIPELLGQPDLAKQVFVIELTSHLCEKYAITKSLNVAKLCFNVAYTLLQLLPSERRALFFVPVLPALLRICKVFPILREDADIILIQINQITLAHMASTSSRLSLGSAKPFEGLEKMTWREVKKLMGSLHLHEALYLCIQRCTLDLDKLKEDSKQNVYVEQIAAPTYNTIFAYGNHVINPSGGG